MQNPIDSYSYTRSLPQGGLCTPELQSLCKQVVKILHYKTLWFHATSVKGVAVRPHSTSICHGVQSARHPRRRFGSPVAAPLLLDTSLRCTGPTGCSSKLCGSCQPVVFDVFSSSEPRQLGGYLRSSFAKLNVHGIPMPLRCVCRHIPIIFLAADT